MATVAVGTIAFAALGGIDVLGFGSQPEAAPVEIVETSPSSTAVGDATVAVTTTTLLGEQPVVGVEPTATTPVGSTGAGAAPGATTPRNTNPAGAAPTTAPVGTGAPSTVAATTPPTAAPTTVTVPRTTTPPATSPPPASTLPAGVPKDWPAGVPIPPKPPGCIDGQLEDNGVWNCQH